MTDLPLVSNNVLDLMKTMAGVRGTGLGEGTTFAGVTTGMVNTSRDGMSVQEGRYAAGVGSTDIDESGYGRRTPVILAPVDAELGRGNGQVQILTRSGTNAHARGPLVAQFGTRCEHVGQQQGGRQRCVEADPADVDQSASGDRECRRSHHQEQDVLLYLV